MKISTATLAADDGNEGLERPRLHLMVIAPLSSSARDGLLKRVRCAEDLLELFAEHGPELSLDLPNRLDPEAQTLALELSFKHPNAFGPRALVEAIPKPANAPTRAISEEPPAPNVERSHQSTAADSQTPEPTEAVNRILHMVRMPNEGERLSATLDRTIAAIAPLSDKKKTGVSGQRSGKGADNTAMETSTSRQLDEILHHPEFQRIESIWMGLKYLIDQCDFEQEISIDIWQCTKTSLGEFLDRLNKEMQGVTSDQTPALVVAPYHFSAIDSDVTALHKLAAFGESLQTPVLSSVALDFLSRLSSHQPDRTPQQRRLDIPGNTLWQEFRHKPAARWIGLSINRFLLRAPYEGSRQNLWNYLEYIRGPSDRLWGDSAWAVAALVIRSAAETGWPTEIGMSAGAYLEDLPLIDQRDTLQTSGPRLARSAAEERAVAPLALIPLEAMLPDRLLEEIADAGFIALTCKRNRDRAFILAAPTVYQERSPLGPKALRLQTSSLAYQLLVARVVRTVECYRERARPLQSETSFREGLLTSLNDLIAASGRGAFVDINICHAVDTRGTPIRTLHVDLRSGERVLGGARVEMTFALGGPTPHVAPDL